MDPPAGTVSLMIPHGQYNPMAGSWKEAKELAAKEGFPLVYHDCDEGIFGACRQGEQQGAFRGGVYFEHRCICMPSHLSLEELEAKERLFFKDNPDW